MYLHACATRSINDKEIGERSAARTKITPNDSPHRRTLSISSDPDGQDPSDLFTCISLHPSLRTDLRVQSMEIAEAQTGRTSYPQYYGNIQIHTDLAVENYLYIYTTYNVTYGLL